VNFDQGWQVVKPCRVRRCAPSAAPKSYSPHYLVVVEGKCLNFLSSSHMRVDCCLPTRCFNCHGFQHHLGDYKRPCKSSIALDISKVVSQALRGTLLPHGDRGTPSALAPSVANCFPEADHIFPIASVCFIPRSWDPMIEEAALGTTVVAPGHSCQEEISVMS
jgi:hypothetical protein